MTSLTRHARLKQTLVLAMVALSGFGLGTIIARITSAIGM